MTAQPVLRIANLTKRYGSHIAVNDASFDVHEGDIFGFLGPNGAGKTTTFSSIAGLITPTSGRIEIFGHPHSDVNAVRPHVGMLIETPAFYEYLSGRKNLELLARMHGGIERDRIDHVLERVGLLGRGGDKVGKYSHGMKQRLGVAQALLHRPRLVLLDEPTNGLDPDGSAQMWALLRSLVATDRMTVVVSSHLLHEVEEACNRIAVINQGSIMACDQVRSLLFFSKEDSLLVFENSDRSSAAETYMSGREGTEVVLRGMEPTLSATGASIIPGEEHTVRVRVQQGGTTVLIEDLVSRGLTPRSVIPQRKTLRQFFLELTRRQPDRPPIR
ncbi:MAG: ABC transporter ATP-binding protein [Gemmatimonadetes bacterium]|nr:ABC transporter ATP-binding protein [Gemmatimonadota bacterium]